MDEEKPAKTDWSKCIFCQTSNHEGLLCPALSKRNEVGTGYLTLENDLQCFGEIGALENQLARLGEKDGIAKILLQNKASWHKSCRCKYDKTTYRRIMKRKLQNENKEETQCKLRRSLNEVEDEASKTSGMCFFCESTSPLKELSTASTLDIDNNVRHAAYKIADFRLIAKLSGGDMIAQHAKYHKKCLVQLYDKARDRDRQEQRVFGEEDQVKDIAFAELVSFLKEPTQYPTVHKLADLVDKYISRLRQLGHDVDRGTVHSSRLKRKLLAYFPGLSEHSQGKHIFLSMKDDVANVLACAANGNFDKEATCLAEAANIIRRDILQFTEERFDGTFEEHCQESSSPKSLITMVKMILYGSSMEDQTLPVGHQEALTISQLIRFNCRRKMSHGSSHFKHDAANETPLPLYVGVMLHSRTRRRELVDAFFQLGLSISYARVLQISTDLGNAVCERFHENGVVCPPQLKQSLFTTAAVDNIDHNPSSTTSGDSFHGTAISLSQHPNFEGEGLSVSKVSIKESSPLNQINQLPESYTVVPQIAETLAVSPRESLMIEAVAHQGLIESALEKEKDWMHEVGMLLEQGLQNTGSIRTKKEVNGEILSWGAYHSRQQRSPIRPKCYTAMMPLFHESAHTASMIRHSMTLVNRATEYLNPGQTPVIVFDQPLYALAKEIQWTWPDAFGEGKFVVMLGGLHLEMAALKTIGKLLDGSGWTDALTIADVYSSGKADSCLQASHVKRTRYAHQVTLATLAKLQEDEFIKYKEECKPESPLSFAAWCDLRETQSAMFLFWNIVIELEERIMLLVRSFRECNFSLYVSVLNELAPWFFSMDRHNYARWLPVHLKDMAELKEKHPCIAREFSNGKFCVQRSVNKFSAISLDQAHEQMNDKLKGDGGMIGLTENSNGLRRWMVSGPEVARIVQEFEDTADEEPTGDKAHHEDSAAFNKRFAKHVNALHKTFLELGSPFREDVKDLFSLENKTICDPEVHSILLKLRSLGQEQYKDFVSRRLMARSVSLKDKIRLNKLAVFGNHGKRKETKIKLKLNAAKNDAHLFGQLYIGCQIRGGNLEEFFSHENRKYPPSLSEGSALRGGCKSDLVGCLEPLVTKGESAPSVTCIVLDGAVIVQMLRPKECSTFEEYSEKMFLPYIVLQLRKVKRLDLVWDEYIDESLKAATRAKRGDGVRRRVQPSVPIPKNWHQFLCIEENKRELFRYLSSEVSKVEMPEKEIVVTTGAEVEIYPQRQTQLAPCNHEEADTRIMLHVAEAATHGHKAIMIRSVDTDVMVLAIYFASKMEASELWVSFGTGKDHRMLPAHLLAKALGPNKCCALPAFHALTGCDTTSFFGGRGKKTAWNVWDSFAGITDALMDIMTNPSSISEESHNLIERFVVLLYDKASNLKKVQQSLSKHLSFSYWV